MKKIVLVLAAAMVIFVSFNSFTNKSSIKENLTKSIISKTCYNQTYVNDELDQQLYLYDDCTCVIRGEGIRGSGTYEIKGAQRIYITWENGIQQQGPYSFKSQLTIEGVTYKYKN